MNDLEFLARYVPEWPNGATYVRLDRDGEICFLGPCADDCDFYPSNRDEAKSCFNEVGGGANTGPHYSESQWLSERARLQNKPSWDDAPKSAKWVAQDCNGEWWFFDSKPWMVRTGFYCLEGKSSKASSGGEVLGDWSDTLERLPNDDSDSPRCSCGRGDQKIIHNINCEIIKMKWDRDKRELYQQNKSSDASAHIHAREKHNYWRGPEDGLPPIGEECEVYRNGEWELCEIIAHIEQPMGTIAVFSYGREPGYGISGVDCLIPRYFRPVDVGRAEKDRAVEEMVGYAQYTDKDHLPATFRLFAADLYRAGYRKLDNPDASN